MGDRLTTEVWRCVRADGSTRDQLVVDVNRARAHDVPEWDRIEILDALDELLATGDVRYDRDTELFRRDQGPFARPPGNVYSVPANERAEALGMTQVEAILDEAWPRSGGRREIIHALAEAVEDIDEQRRELARCLHALVNEYEGARANAVAVLGTVKLVAKREGWSVDGRDS